MKGREVLHSSKSDEWLTPLDFFQGLDREFHFTLDPCCGKADYALCDNFFTPEEDGLKQDWGKHRVYCNPPYGDISAWVEKCFNHSQHGGLSVMLIPSRTDTRYWHQWIEPGRVSGDLEVRFVKGRLKFGTPDDPEGLKSDPAPFPSAVIIMRPNMPPF